jgi:hypothetical protein
VFISGVLLFACPLFVGLTAHDYILDRPTIRLAHYIVGSAVVFAVMIACGIWTSSSSWNKYSRDVCLRS